MKSKTLFFFIALIALVLLLGACGEKATSENDNNDNNDNEIINTENNNNNDKDSNNDYDDGDDNGMPIVDEPITLKFMTGKSPSTADDYNELLIWKEYEKMTNIKIDWGLVAVQGLEEKRNISLAGGNIPDVYYTASMPNSDLQKYGDQGIFVALNDLIDEHMPNLTKLLDEDPSLRAGLTFPDGNIYSLPTIHDPEYLEVRLGMAFWIREDWLEELGMDLPETTDDFYEYLKAVKETDLLGDGSGKEVPFGAHNLAGLKDVMKGSFGVGNKGHGNGYVDLDPETEEPRFFPTAEGYKEMLEYLHKLYSEELIEQNIFTIDTQQSFANGTEGLYGSTVISGTEGVYGKEEGSKFTGMNALKGPHGDQQVTRIGPPLNSRGGFVVTNKNEYVPETLKWMDYFYSDEGATLYFMGVEGETYEIDENGEKEYVDEFYNTEGKSFDQVVSKYFSWLGGGYPGLVKKEFFKSSSEEKVTEAADRVRPYVEDVWPGLLLTPEENKKMSSVGTDIEKYVTEMFDKFVAGDESLDNWDKYVKEIETMGLDEYMEIYDAAYERLKENEE